MKLNHKKVLPVTGLIVSGIIIGILFASNLQWTPFASAGKAAPETFLLPENSAPNDAVLQLQNTSKAFTAVSKEVLPSVVSISTSKIVKRTAQDNPFSPLFREWFGKDFDEAQPQNQKLEGLGSGVIINAEGYILTNHHVIENADDIKVGLYDNRQFEGKLIASDPLTEVAVIKIEGDNLPVARLGDSDTMEIGEWVLAVGNPLGLNSTVTAGIISALNRKINIIRDESGHAGGYALEDFIQTDAAINPGNSGGALVNLSGEVIGINTAIATRTGGYQGYGFAVPINLAKRIMKDLINQGYVSRAWLGISMLPVTENVAERYKLDKIEGAVVQSILEDSPAEKAGLKQLDIIQKVDGREIQDPGDVQRVIAMKNPDDTVDIVVLRDGKSKKIEVKLGKRDTGKEGEKVSANTSDDTPDLGLTVQNLTDEIRNQYEAYRNIQGVLISRVEQYSPAEDAGIVRGDVVVKIEEDAVKSVSDYRKVLKQYKKGQVVIFHIARQDDEFAAFVKIPEK